MPQIAQMVEAQGILIISERFKGVLGFLNPYRIVASFVRCTKVGYSHSPQWARPGGAAKEAECEASSRQACGLPWWLKLHYHSGHSKIVEDVCLFEWRYTVYYMKILRSCPAMATKIDWGVSNIQKVSTGTLCPWSPPFELMTSPQCSRLKKRSKHLRLNMKPWNGFSISTCQILSNHDSKMV